MKRSILAAVMASAFLALPMPVQAQDQAPEMMWFTVFTDHVKPSMAMEYETKIGELVDAFTAAGVDMNWVAISGPELGYAYAVAGLGPDDHSDMYATFQSGVEGVGPEKFMGIMSAAMESVESQEMYYLMLRSELSYKPEAVGFDPEKPMRHYTLLKVLPGKEMAMEEVARQFKALYEKHGIERGWRFYQYMTGSELPAYLVVESAKDEHDHHMMEAENYAVFGDEAEALRGAARAASRGMETMSGWVRPDLSYPRLEMTADGE